MRIIAGQFKGRRLTAPSWDGLRPTSDKLRERLFNILAPRIDGARVLDGYAGTGAVGIEALSRGAAHVWFVEQNRRAAALIEQNLAVCGVEQVYTIDCGDIVSALRRLPAGARFDLILLDPPYDAANVVDALAAAAGWLAEGGVLVLERATRREPELPEALTRVRDVRSGDSTLTFMKASVGLPDGLLPVTTSSERNRQAARRGTPRRTPARRDGTGAAGVEAEGQYQQMTPPAPPNGRLAIFPGSFDPLTNGHVDIILRSAHLFERIIVSVLVNAEKMPLFTADERVTIIREVFREYPNIEVDTFDGLLVDYARRRRASAIVRGLRAVSDFEYEFQMALMNRHLEPTLETVFMMPAEQYTYLSSRLIKEVFSLGGDVRGLVPTSVETWMRRKHDVGVKT